MRKNARNILLLLALGMIAYGQFAEASEPVATDMHEDVLTGSHWWVEDIEGHGVIDASHTTVGFPETGKVGGDTSCNRYFGGYESDGNQISFGPLAGTRRACAESLMNQEMHFYQAMETITAYEIADTGLLHLKDEHGHTMIRAWRIEDGEA